MDIPSKVGRYTLHNILGAGSFGSVYLGTFPTPSTPFAIKVINIEALITQRSPYDIPEIQNLLRLRFEEYISKIEEVILIPPNLYIVMEYCAGGDLDKILKLRVQTRQPIPMKILKNWFSQIMKGYQNLHTQGLIHRDIKPQNILLTHTDIETAEIRIADFGVSKCFERLNSSMTITGTSKYMSPEMLNIERYDYKTDIYSIGVVFYELISLKYPFSRGDYDRIVHKEMMTEGIHFLDSVPISVQDLVRRMMEYDKNQRIGVEDILNHDFFKCEFSATDVIHYSPSGRSSEGYTEPIQRDSIHIPHSASYTELYIPTHITYNLTESIKSATTLYETAVDYINKGNNNIYIGFMHMEVALNTLNISITYAENELKKCFKHGIHDLYTQTNDKKLCNAYNQAYESRLHLFESVANFLARCESSFEQNCINYIKSYVYTLMQQRKLKEAWSISDISIKWKPRYLIEDIYSYYHQLNILKEEGNFSI